MVLSLASWINIVISQDKLLVGGIGTLTRQGPRVAVGQTITNLKEKPKFFNGLSDEYARWGRKEKSGNGQYSYLKFVWTSTFFRFVVRW